jgi:L-arabinokinase
LVIAFYISGHGFGHASRQIEIMNALAARRPDLQILLRTAVPRWLPERTLTARHVLVDRPCDTGIVQIDSLRLDAKATIDAAREFYDGLEARSREEAALLRDRGVRLVVADAPPLACSAAVEAGLDAIVISNFTWDWIYEEYREWLPAAPRLISTIEHAYGQAIAGWRLPMHGGFASFANLVDLPFVARHARHGRDETRAAFGLPLDRPLVLSSFGGYGVDGLDLNRLDCLDTWAVAVTGRPGAVLPRGVHLVEDGQIYTRGFRYEDLVNAADVVLTKPGYGIVSECLANRTAMVYTSRGRFAEYPVLVSAMQEILRSAYLPHEDLFAGRWRAALDAAHSAPAPPRNPPTNGAEVVASMIESLVPGP